MKGSADDSTSSIAGSVLLTCSRCSLDSVSTVLGDLDTVTQIHNGSIGCDRCGEEYRVIEGIPIVIPSDMIQPVNVPSDEIDDEHTRFGFPPTRRIAETLRRNSHGLSLDVGCGKAPYMDCFRGGLVVTDINYYFVREALSMDGARGRALGVVADAVNLPFMYGSFDNVFCMEMLEHLDIPDALAAVEQFKRIARVRVQVDVPNEVAMLRYIRGLFHRFGIFDTTEHEDAALDYHSSFSASLLRGMGFKVHGCIGVVSRMKIPLGVMWDIYDTLAWRFPGIAGTLIGTLEKPVASARDSSTEASL